MSDRRHVFERLGLRPVVNADARLTVLGGSRMPPEVTAAMVEASQRYVDLHALQQQVGSRLAMLTRNEAALVTAGAAAGLVLSVLACRNAGNLRRIARGIEGPIGEDASGPDEVVIHRAHRIPYDPAVRLAGGRLIEVGNVLQSFAWELEAAMGPRTAAVLYVAGSHLARGALPLKTVVEIASSHDVPVIVDAAAQLPPVENLWSFTTEQHAALAVFSGGKDLEGPQASGLLVGQKSLVDAARANAAPHQRLARAMKVGREEMVGLLAAVERYVGLDHDSRIAAWESVVARWVAELSALDGVHATRVFPNEAGQPTPRALVTLDPRVHGWTARALRDALWDGDPQIAVALEPDDASSISMSPDPLGKGEEDVVTEALCRVLSHRRPADPGGGSGRSAEGDDPSSSGAMSAR